MSSLIQALSLILPQRQVVTDPLRRLAYGTDASFYRLVPEVVAVVESEQEVQALLRVARAHRRPVTFRAAGTSLSGQAITDGVLALIGESFATCEIPPDAATVRLGPGIVGGEVNLRLAPFGRKIGPDPASINACKIGGIAANNASGMCCGTAQNSYRTLAGVRVVLADGTVLDTEDATSVAAFRQSHASLLTELEQLGVAARADSALAARIRHKYKIKNTTGYSLNALVDFEDPIDILAHLMMAPKARLASSRELLFAPSLKIHARPARWSSFQPSKQHVRPSFALSRNPSRRSSCSTVPLCVRWRTSPECRRSCVCSATKRPHC